MAVSSRALVPTEHASRYLQQLCKHWSHKFEVTFDAHRGTIPFPEDRHAVFKAEETTLTLDVSAPDEASLARFEEIVANHLRRFAFREDLVIDWNRSV